MTSRRTVAAGTAVLALALAACTTDDGSDTASEGASSASEGASAASGEASSASASASASASGSAAPAGDLPTGEDVGCDAAEGAVVGYSQPIPDPNFAAIEAVMENALGQYGATLSATNANLDPGKQISDIQSLLGQGVAVLVANPVDPNATQPVFDQARSSDVPIVAQDTAVGGPFFATVLADVEDAAAQGAQILSEEVGDGQVGAIVGPEFAEVLVRQAQSFSEASSSNGLDVVETQTNAQITPDGAAQIANAYKQKYGSDLAGIWTFNDTSAVGVASVLDDSFSPALVSINGQPEALPLVEQGVITATFDLQQDKIGQALAYAALAAICDREIPDEIVVPARRIDSSNVGEFRPLGERTSDPFDLTLEMRDGRAVVAGSSVTG